VSAGRAPLGAHHPDVRELRRLLKSARARAEARCFVIEGPRLLRAALDHDAEVVEVFVAPDARDRAEIVAAAARGITVRELAAGVAERAGDTHTSQGVLARCTRPPAPIDALDGHDLVVVVDAVSDPGNAGTLVRSAAGAGAGAILLGPGSVDAYNPKVVRASAGAIFGVPIVEGSPTVEMLERLGTGGVRRVGAVAHGGTPLDDADLTGPLAIVLGHETRGLGPLPLDASVTVPLARGESLNLAMAGTVLCFEAARRRRVASR